MRFALLTTSETLSIYFPIYTYLTLVDSFLTERVFSGKLLSQTDRHTGRQTERRTDRHCFLSRYRSFIYILIGDDELYIVTNGDLTHQKYNISYSIGFKTNSSDDNADNNEIKRISRCKDTYILRKYLITMCIFLTISILNGTCNREHLMAATNLSLKMDVVLLIIS